MDDFISSSASFNIIDISASMQLHIENEAVVPYEEYKLTLCATKNTNIVLDSGKHLSEVKVNFTLSSKFKAAQEIDRELTANDLGFLIHTQESNGIPSVHGLVPLFDRSVLQNLFVQNAKGYITIDLPTVPFEDDKSKPFIWGKNRQNVLRINGLSVSSLRNQEKVYYE